MKLLFYFNDDTKITAIWYNIAIIGSVFMVSTDNDIISE